MCVYIYIYAHEMHAQKGLTNETDEATAVNKH